MTAGEKAFIEQLEYLQKVLRQRKQEQLNEGLEKLNTPPVYNSVAPASEMTKFEVYVQTALQGAMANPGYNNLSSDEITSMVLGQVLNLTTEIGKAIAHEERCIKGDADESEEHNANNCCGCGHCGCDDSGHS